MLKKYYARNLLISQRLIKFYIWGILLFNIEFLVELFKLIFMNRLPI